MNNKYNRLDVIKTFKMILLKMLRTKISTFYVFSKKHY